jgi:hypothetical protein
MIFTIGDSVSWGQGLIEPHKFDVIVANSKARQLKRSAHSGATIGTRTDSSAEIEPGEIPIASPSLWQQVLAQGDWSQFELVLVNGGINDVSLTRILSPWTSTEQLKQWIDQFCNQAMQGLLVEIANRLGRPDARIAVLGYYPILSSQSDLTSVHFQSLLELHGVATSSVIQSDAFSLSDLVPSVVENCLTFWRSSGDALRTAVANVNKSLGREMCLFVPLPFSEENAMWAEKSLLWELTPILLPEDEVSDPRAEVCKTLYGDVVHIPMWIQCVRASAGHPRVEGAARIAEALIAAL